MSKPQINRVCFPAVGPKVFMWKEVVWEPSPPFPLIHGVIHQCVGRRTRKQALPRPTTPSPPPTTVGLLKGTGPGRAQVTSWLTPEPHGVPQALSPCAVPGWSLAYTRHRGHTEALSMRGLTMPRMRGSAMGGALCWEPPGGRDWFWLEEACWGPAWRRWDLSCAQDKLEPLAREKWGLLCVGEAGDGTETWGKRPHRSHSGGDTPRGLPAPPRHGGHAPRLG